VNTTDTHTTDPTDEHRPSSRVWLWALLAVAVVLLLTFNILALIPVGIVLTVAGVIRRLTAASPQDRSLGYAVAAAGLALVAVPAALGLLLIPVGEPEVTLEGVHDEPAQSER
jgi:hypothetical protein